MTIDDIQAVSARLESAYPEDVLEWTFDTFGDGAAMATGFGPSGVSLMHMLSRVRPTATVFYLDTDLLFPETHDLKRRLSDRLGIRITRVHSGLSLQEQGRKEGTNLWRSDPDRCCYLRKVVPLRRFLETKDAWITGIRRDQSPTRRDVGVVEWDRTHELVKVNPLARWSEEQIWKYIKLHDLPYNVLHDRGFPSIGCIPCTKPVSDGGDARSGRWQGHEKLECGIHEASGTYRKTA
jgi:phosphoadenosine phosphosulfate reductase